MKLLVQSDDYGITRAAAQGCLHGIRNGIVRNTGFFSNMPWAEETAEWIRPYLNDIAFGIDLNASTGPSVLPHESVPALTHENGMFLSSKENRALDNDENNHDHLAEHYDELYAEFDAQIQRFIKLIGKTPDYIHNHAYGTKTTEIVTMDLVKKYKVPDSSTLMKITDADLNTSMGWYVFGGPEAQLTEDLKSYLTEDKGGLLKKEISYLITHCGYCDADLFSLSSFNTCRVKDLEALTSDEVKNWVKNNQIELITFNDIRNLF